MPAPSHLARSSAVGARLVSGGAMECQALSEQDKNPPIQSIPANGFDGLVAFAWSFNPSSLFPFSGRPSGRWFLPMRQATVRLWYSVVEQIPCR
jgi:hypothetical protein